MAAMRIFRHTDGVEQRMVVADINDSPGPGTFVRPVVVYSDPPWSPGNEKWWRRHAKLQPPESYDRFVDSWCRWVAACSPTDVFVEQSINPKHRGILLKAVARCPAWGLELIEQWEVLYGSAKAARPNVLLHFGDVKLKTDPAGLRGEPMTRRVFEGLEPCVVADPCSGKGMTSRMAHHFGFDFFGTELNPKRMEKAVAWILKKGYVESVSGRCDASDVVALIDECGSLPIEDRIEVYNRVSSALGSLVEDVTGGDPVCSAQLLPAAAVQANDYNPNKVAGPEMDLLETSIREDGVTMPVVVIKDGDRWVLVDGFHRHSVIAGRLDRLFIPCSVIDKDIGDRMASISTHLFVYESRVDYRFDQ